jgi:GTP-binding protein
MPGYGFAKVSDTLRRHWGRLLQDYFEIRDSLTDLILVVDARRQLQNFDR